MEKARLRKTSKDFKYFFPFFASLAVPFWEQHFFNHDCFEEFFLKHPSTIFSFQTVIPELPLLPSNSPVSSL